MSVFCIYCIFCNFLSQNKINLPYIDSIYFALIGIKKQANTYTQILSHLSAQIVNFRDMPNIVSWNAFPPYFYQVTTLPCGIATICIITFTRRWT